MNDLPERLEAGEEWMRYPENADHLSLKDVMDWLNLRPFGLFNEAARALRERAGAEGGKPAATAAPAAPPDVAAEDAANSEPEPRSGEMERLRAVLRSIRENAEHLAHTPRFADNELNYDTLGSVNVFATEIVLLIDAVLEAPEGGSP